MEEDQDLLCETRIVQTNIDYFREFLVNILPRKLSKLSPFLGGVRVVEDAPVGSIARFRFVDKTRLWPDHAVPVSTEMLKISAIMDGNRLEIELQQNICAPSFYTAVRDLIEGRWPAARDLSAELERDYLKPTASVSGTPAKRSITEPREETVRHNLGFAYMLEHACSWQTAFNDAWLPAYEKDIKKKVRLSDVQYLKEAFRVAVSRRQKMPAKT